MDIDIDTLLELDPVKIALDTKNGGYDMVMSVFKTTGEHLSIYDHLTLNELFNKLCEKRKSGHSSREVIQAIYNYYAKKLSVPPLRVCYGPKGDSTYAAFMYGIDSYSKNATRIAISKSMVNETNPRFIFHAFAHESKHEEQQYNCYNYFKHHIIPKTQLGMFHIISKLLLKMPYMECFAISYSLNPEELDAYLYDLEASKHLIKKFDCFRQADYISYHYFKMQSILCKFEYNKEGLNNKHIKAVLKAYKKDIYVALSGGFGKKYQKAFKELFSCGFNLEKAFSYFTQKLDTIHDEFVCLAQKMREEGYFVPWERNGNLLYKNETQKSGMRGKNLLSRSQKAKNVEAFIRHALLKDTISLFQK